jgi:hypothetical protein
MATPLVRSSLRRSSAPTGVLAFLCLLFTPASLAATPTPDLPPPAVAPERPPVAKTVPAPVRQAPVRSAKATVEPVQVIRPAAPVGRGPSAQPATKPKPTVRPKPTKSAAPTKRATLGKHNVVSASAAGHDRGPVPLAAFAPTVEELNRGLAALAGAALAFVALGGALVLVTARRELAR